MSIKIHLQAHTYSLMLLIIINERETHSGKLKNIHAESEETQNEIRPCLA